MRNWLLGLVLAGSQLEAQGCLEWINDIGGWLYAGPTGKYNTYKDHQSFFNTGLTPEETFATVKANSIGVQAGAGLVFPIPFFFAVDGAYTKLYSSTFNQLAITEGITTVTPLLRLDGDFYTYEFKGGFLIQPLFCTPWTLYPVFAYNTDKIHVFFPNFPFPIPPNTEVRFFELKNKLTFSGPAVGIGNSYLLPYGFFINGEVYWQFREFTNIGRNKVELFAPPNILLNTNQHSGFSTWTQGPKVNLNLGYIFCNWFAQLSGEWQYLSQFTSSEGMQDEEDILFDLNTQKIVHRDFYESPLRVQKVRWENWIWKASIGFTF